jgi:hypothetical protein
MIARKTTQLLVETYLDRVNNYLTLEKFAEHNGLDLDFAKKLLELGKMAHEQPELYDYPSDK